MPRPIILISAIAAACATLPSAASAQTYFGFSVSTGYPHHWAPYYDTPQRYYDYDDARAYWIARYRWEQHRRWEEHERWEREEARRHWQHEYWEHNRWHDRDDDDD